MRDVSPGGAASVEQGVNRGRGAIGWGGGGGVEEWMEVMGWVLLSTAVVLVVVPVVLGVMLSVLEN